ncbi:MAG: hypothetical protein ACRDHW_20440 [Ktedonobacteraceae bacterium]
MHPLKAARFKLSYTQKMLAEFSLVGLATIQRAESGKALRGNSAMQLCSFFSEQYHRAVTPQELGLALQEDYQQQDSAMKSAPFLTLSGDALLQRYSEESLLQIDVDWKQWTLPQVLLFDNTVKCLPLSALHVEVDAAHPIYEIPAQIAGKAHDVLS